jgi:hypothetical protein
MINSLVGFITNGQDISLFQQTKQIDTSKFDNVGVGVSRKQQELEKKMEMHIKKKE